MAVGQLSAAGLPVVVARGPLDDEAGARVDEGTGATFEGDPLLEPPQAAAAMATATRSVVSANQRE
ncbi:MAG: hypothetical protein ACXWOW_01990 [Candidatus Limnocylindrales bacterium]